MGYFTQSNSPGGSAGFTTGVSGVNQYGDYRQSPLENSQLSALNRQSDYQYGNGFGGQSQAAKDALGLAHVGVDAQMSRFNTILPYLTGQFGELGAQMSRAGGDNGTPPPISTGPVLNSQQIQQQVNQQRAANDQSTQGQIARSNASVAGRGFGGNSPLAMQLAQGYQNQNLATNTQNEASTRLNAAQGNADHLLNSQQALSNQWATGNQLDIQRRAPIYAHQNALLAALSGLV